MKKLVPSLLLFALYQPVFAQGFLNKIKTKINSTIEKPAQAPQPQSPQQGDVKYTDPSQYGTVIYTFSKSDIEKHMGGDGGSFALWFQNVSVTNNQLKFQMVDYDQVYDYTGGKLVNTGSKTTQQVNNQYTGSEYDLMSKDFTQMDMQNAMLNKGRHVGSGMVPGKATQSVTFNGKPMGSYMMFSVAHNADSSAIAVLGTTFVAGKMASSITLSGGQTMSLPSAVGAPLYISPDGKLAAAILLINVPEGQPNVYISNGTKTFFKDGGANNLTWLRNSGGFFNVGGDGKTLYRDGEVYHAFDDHYESDPHTIFIGKDDKNMCWVGNHTLRFSDGTIFENGASPRKVIIDGKEVVIFLTVNVTSGQVYLCRHDL